MSHEFGLVNNMQMEKMEEKFMEGWRQYSHAIIRYAEATKTKSKELKHALREENYEGICNPP